MPYKSHLRLALILVLTITVILLNENKLLTNNQELNNNPNHINKALSDFNDLSKVIYPNQTVEQKKFCRLPRLDLEGHDSTEKYKNCKQRAEWGYLKFNHWHLNLTVVKVLKHLKCQYRSVTRINDFKLKYSEMMDLQDKQSIDDDVIEVTCKAEFFHRPMVFNHLYVQIVPKINAQMDYTKIDTAGTCKPLNVILLSYDSLSRVSWFKRLPRTTDFILNEMKFDVLYGQSILGDGTPACMIPLLTGKTEEELPSALKSDPNGSYVDQVYPFIWNELHPRGYMSYHMEDWPQVTTFTYRMRGMSNKTCHHYMRPYQLSVWNRVSGNYNSGKDDLCIGSVKRHRKSLDVMTDFIETYKDNSKNHLAIMHYIENSHDGNQRAQQIDGDLVEFLRTNWRKDNFKNTAIFLYSDHGVRFGKERNAPQGYLEERQPFFSIYLPPEYRNANPGKMKSLKKNAQQLTSPFDIHETIRDVTCLASKRLKRAMSVLGEIPIERTCAQMGISLHYCVCQQDWQDIEVKGTLAQNAAIFTIEYINTKLLSLRSKFCHVLSLEEVSSCKQAIINNETYLKVNFRTGPNLGTYEVLVKNIGSDLEPRFFISSSKLISRNNAYGKQPKCLEKAPKKAEITVDLRKFCFCKNL